MSLIFNPKVTLRPKRTMKEKTLGDLSHDECNRLVELRAIAQEVRTNSAHCKQTERINKEGNG